LASLESEAPPASSPRNVVAAMVIDSFTPVGKNPRLPKRRSAPDMGVGIAVRVGLLKNRSLEGALKARLKEAGLER